MSDPLQARALGHTCAACELWQRSVERQQRALAELGLLVAPAALDECVAAELAGERTRRVERVLSSMVRIAAPAALDELVAAQFELPASTGDEERGRQKADALRALDVQSAPPVLERLVNEELESPEKHRVERLSGGLERLEAPPELRARIGAHVQRRAVLRILLGPVAMLAAAALVVWLVARQPRPAPRSHRFEVVRAASLDELDPLARSLVEGLSGLPGRTGEAR